MNAFDIGGFGFPDKEPEDQALTQRDLPELAGWGGDAVLFPDENGLEMILNQQWFESKQVPAFLDDLS